MVLSLKSVQGQAVLEEPPHCKPHRESNSQATGTQHCPGLQARPLLPHLDKASRKVSQKRAKHTRVPPRNANLINNIEGIFRKKHPTPPFLTKTGLEAHPNRPPARLARAGGQRKSQPDERRFSAVCRQPATAQAACRGRAKSRPGLACLRSREGCVPSRSRSRSALRQQRG